MPWQRLAIPIPGSIGKRPSRVSPGTPTAATGLRRQRPSPLGWLKAFSLQGGATKSGDHDRTRRHLRGWPVSLPTTDRKQSTRMVRDLGQKAPDVVARREGERGEGAA